MPATTGLSTSQVRLANAAFALTYFKRAMKSVWPRVCGTTKSSSQFEAFAYNGASPPIKLFQGSMESQAIMSYSLQVPNPVWKNIEIIKRNQFEFDQTDSLIKSRVGMIGVTIAQVWDYLLAGQMIKGNTSGSQNFVMPETGVSYTMTADNLSIYNTAHTTGGSATFSNIITGALPDTVALLNSQDIAVSANQVQLDIQNLIARIATVTDDKGNMLLPDFDASEQLVILYPPCLTAVMAMAFKTTGTIGGSNGSSSGATTNIGQKMVKDLIAFPLLQGCLDITNKVPGATCAPVYPTAYYAMILGDFVQPWYQQRFVPLAGADVIGGDPAAEATRVLKQAGAMGLPVTPESADMYASTEIMTNLGQLGNRATIDIATQEQFFISGRLRGMLYPGPSYLNWKVTPTGITS